MEPQKSRKRITLSNGEAVEVVVVAYQISKENLGFDMLHNCRQEPDSRFYIPMDKAVEAFNDWCCLHQPLFADLKDNSKFDLLVVAPSSKKFAGMLGDHSAIEYQTNISARFSKLDGTSSAEPDTDATSVYRSISYRAEGDEKEATSIAIIDDVVDGGKTVAAIIQRLREAGISSEATVVVFCAHYRFGKSIADVYRAMKSAD